MNDFNYLVLIGTATPNGQTQKQKYEDVFHLIPNKGGEDFSPPPDLVH
jgi:hypothetical protein